MAEETRADQELEREAEQTLLDYYGVGTGEVGRG